MSAFHNEAALTDAVQAVTCLVITVTATGYAWYLWKRLPAREAASC